MRSIVYKSSLNRCQWQLIIRLAGGHHVEELLETDLAIAVDVGLQDHLVQLVVREVDAESGKKHRVCFLIQFLIDSHCKQNVHLGCKG